VNNKVAALNTPPLPTFANPFAQVKWIFFRVEAESSSSVARSIRWAREKYIGYIVETRAGYAELESDPRFFIHQYWEPDALVRFNDWVLKQRLASKTRYGLHKAVRGVMNFAYGLRVIDAMVYQAPMFKGVAETDQRSAYLEEEQEVINAAVARWIGLAEKVVCGYTPSGEGVPYRRRVNTNAKAAEDDSPDTNSFLVINGKFFNSSINGRKFLSVKELAETYGLRSNVVRSRFLQGLSVEQVVGLEKVERKGHSRRQVTLEGVTYSSIQEAVRTYGANLNVVTSRLKARDSVEQAFGLVPRVVKQSDDRALLWAFENEYSCNPALMESEFVRRKMNYAATTDRLRKLFMRWGVWPYIDDYLVMPLAVEFAMLTGLNVESIKELDTDCFTEEHALTGKAVLKYRKRRSGSSKRPEEKELHLPLLELEELHLEESNVEKVRRLFSLVLAVTESIRADAPEEIKNRLFIFQDVERSNKEERIVIVEIDPRRKAGKWYRRFVREENLHALLGDDFSFNLARCRPTLVTNLVLAGVDMLKIQAICAHANIGTTATYLDERQLKPAFNKTASEALQAIAGRSRKVFSEKTARMDNQDDRISKSNTFAETLSGCGCADPYSPSDSVRKVTSHKAGTVCKFWNMCFFCDRAVITEDSLPKLIVYKNRIDAALKYDAPSIRSRKELFSDVVKMIDSIVNTEEIFPQKVIDNATVVAASLDDVLVDQLVYQGL